MHVGRALILAQALEARMPQAPVARPFGIGDFGDEARLKPYRAPPLRRRHRDKGRGLALERLETLGDFAEIGIAESGAHFAGIVKRAVLEGAEQKRGKRAALDRRAAIAADHEFGALPAFDLEPGLAAARAIGRVRPFRHDAFEPRGARARQEGAPRSLHMIGIDEARGDGLAREQLGEADLALAERRLAPILAVELEQIEQEIADRLVRAVDMLLQRIPVTLTFRGVSHPKSFHYEVLNNAKITPAAMMATVFNAIQGMNEYGEDTTYRLDGDISVLGYPKLAVKDMYAPADGSTPTAYGIALALGEHFSRIFENPYETPKIEGVELNFDLIPDRRSARLESARTDVTEARPGDEITIEALLRPYRGESILRQIAVKIPTSAPRGTLHILVSDGDTLDKMHHLSAPMSRHLDLGSTIALLNKEHSNSDVYVSLLEANPQAMVEDKVMPTLPLSVMNVMDGMRGTQDMVVVGESAVDEAATPIDYVVTGSQVITLNIK